MIRSLYLVAACALAATAAEPFDLVIEDKPLIVALERLADLDDATLVVPSSLSSRVQRSTRIAARDATWAQVGQQLAAEHGLRLVRAPGWLTVEDHDQAYDRSLVWRLYDAAALLVPREDHDGPDLSLPQSGGKGATLMPPIEADQVLDIPQALAADLPEPLRGRASIDQHGGWLAVLADPEQQRIIAQRLQTATQRAQHQVVIHAWRLPPGAGQAQVDAAAWAGLLPQAEAVGLVIAHADQRLHHAAIHVQQMIPDTDVVQRVHQPIVTKVSTGTVLDVLARPVDGGLLLEVYWSVARPLAAAEHPVRDGTGKVLVPITLPRVTYEYIRSTCLIPPGGAALWPGRDATWAVTWDATGD